jgi:hypothetical protein
MFDPQSDPVLLRVPEEQHPYNGGIRESSRDGRQFLVHQPDTVGQ